MNDKGVKDVPQGVIADDALWLLNNCLAGVGQAGDQVAGQAKDLAGGTNTDQYTEGKT